MNTSFFFTPPPPENSMQTQANSVTSMLTVLSLDLDCTTRELQVRNITQHFSHGVVELAKPYDFNLTILQ